MTKIKKHKNVISKFLMFICLISIPFFVGLEIFIINNVEKFNETFKMSVLGILTFLILMFIILIIYNKYFKFNSFKRLGFLLVFCAFLLEIFGVSRLFYYNDSFKSWLINSSFGSINYKHIASSIYGESIINDVVEVEDVDLSGDLVDFSDISYNNNVYANKYEEEILNREEGAVYKIININGTTIGADYHYEGYMAVIYDPSRVSLAKSSGAGVDESAYGEILSDISRKNGALLAINAGGFYDPNWSSNGGIPHGDVIIDGVVDTSFDDGIEGGGFIGFDSNNKLVLKNMSSEEALAMGIRDAVDWGPFLIVDGVNRYSHVNYYSWACARTAIAQRADGIVLLLVIDGLQDHSKGAGYADLAQILERYGAVNAASMDGGTSTAMTIDHKYINSPWNGYVKTYRWLPNAWIVK